MSGGRIQANLKGRRADVSPAPLSVGCKMVPNNEWPSAPLEVPILGLKELEESE